MVQSTRGLQTVGGERLSEKFGEQAPTLNLCPHTGVTIIKDSLPHARTVSIGLYIRSGAAHERANESGISHFLEHLVFKGPVTSSLAFSRGMDITEAMAELGSHVNAYTTDEHTSYYATCLPEVAQPTLELLLELLTLKFSEQDVALERAVILEEMRQYRDDPSYTAHEKGLRFFAPRHPLTKSIIGTEASLRRLTKQQIEEFFFARYSTGNIALSLAGDLSGLAPESALARFASHLKRGETGSGSSSTALKPRRGIQRLTKRGIHTSHLVGFWPGVSELDPRKFALELWCDIVGAGSRFAWRLVEPGLVDSAGLSCEPRCGTGYVMLSAHGSPERSERVESEIRSILADTLTEPITADELAQSQAMTQFALASGEETATDRMTANGDHWIAHGVAYPAKAEQAAFAAVTLEQVNQFAKDFQWQDSALTIVSPEP